jgi:hypothetical protein
MLNRMIAGLFCLAIVTTSASGASSPAESSAQPAESAKPLVLPKPPDRPVPSRKRLQAMVDQGADRFGVERALAHSLVSAESNYNPHAVSRAGAVGLMQVMPATAADYGVTQVDHLFDPATNVRVGMRHLARLIRRYGIGKAVMAYNAGEGALDRSNGFVTYSETQRYTHRVLTSYLRKKGLKPYSTEAHALTGVTLTPAMARAGSSGSRGRLLRRIDGSRLSLRIRPTLSIQALSPSVHRVGPDSQPMFVLDPARTD